MKSQACQLWLQICSQLEDGSKQFDAAAQEPKQRADAQVNQGLTGILDQSNSSLLLVPALLLRARHLPPYRPTPVWRELLKAEVSAAFSQPAVHA